MAVQPHKLEMYALAGVAGVAILFAVTNQGGKSSGPQIAPPTPAESQQQQQSYAAAYGAYTQAVAQKAASAGQVKQALANAQATVDSTSLQSTAAENVASLAGRSQTQVATTQANSANYIAQVQSAAAQMIAQIYGKTQVQVAQQQQQAATNAASAQAQGNFWSGLFGALGLGFLFG